MFKVYMSYSVYDRIISTEEKIATAGCFNLYAVNGKVMDKCLSIMNRLVK